MSGRPLMAVLQLGAVMVLRFRSTYDYFNYLALHECSHKPAQSLKKSTVSPMS
jgi:hypothetical protein